jgi:hypothetical protein
LVERDGFVGIGKIRRSVSSRQIIEALIADERDEKILAQYLILCQHPKN